MAPEEKTNRMVSVGFWAIVGLILLGSGLFLYRLKGQSAQPDPDQERFQTDAERMRKLQEAKFVPAAASAKPGDWPQWRGPNRDGVSTETGLLTDWSASGPPLVWKAKSGAGYSALAIADGRACTILQDGDSEAVVCWDADSGAELWRFRYLCQYVNEYGSGPRSTPTVAGGRVFAVSATGLFHCLDAATGDLLWKHDLLKEFNATNLQWGVALSPLVEDDLVFTNPGGPAGNSVAAFKVQDGAFVWKALDDPGGYSSPLAATLAGKRQIVFFTGAALVGVDPRDGTLFWRYPWQTNGGCNIATPIVTGNYILISSGYGKGCALVEISADGSGALQATAVYEHNRMRNHFSSSVLYQEYVYGFHDSFLACMNLRTGKICWKTRGFDKGALLIADGHLIILGEKGKLALAEPSPEGYRQKAAFQVSQKKCWTVPVLANGKLYVRDEEQVLCLDLHKK